MIVGKDTAPWHSCDRLQFFVPSFGGQLAAMKGWNLLEGCWWHPHIHKIWGIFQELIDWNGWIKLDIFHPSSSKHLNIGQIPLNLDRLPMSFWCLQPKPPSFLAFMIFMVCFKSTMEPWFLFPWNLSYELSCNIFILIQWVSNRTSTNNFLFSVGAWVQAGFRNHDQSWSSSSPSSASAAQVMVRKRYDRHAKASSKEQAVVIAASELNRLRALEWFGMIWNGWVKTHISVSISVSWCEYMWAGFLWTWNMFWMLILGLVGFWVPRMVLQRLPTNQNFYPQWMVALRRECQAVDQGRGRDMQPETGGS